MAIYLMNSFPNALMPTEGSALTVKGLSAKQVVNLISCPNHYADYDDNIAPHELNADVISCVGHSSTADLFSKVLGAAVGAQINFNALPLDIPVNRVQANPQAGDVVVAGLFTSNRRLAEGELYSEQDILAMPIKWIMVSYG